MAFWEYDSLVLSDKEVTILMTMLDNNINAYEKALTTLIETKPGQPETDFQEKIKTIRELSYMVEEYKRLKRAFEMCGKKYREQTQGDRQDERI